MFGKLLFFKKKEESLELTMAQIDLRPDRAECYQRLLNRLKNQEKLMNNPLLSDWCAIRNKIRAIERKLREISYESNK
jgi:hypothetical protein